MFAISVDEHFYRVQPDVVFQLLVSVDMISSEKAQNIWS